MYGHKVDNITLRTYYKDFDWLVLGKARKLFLSKNERDSCDFGSAKIVVIENVF
jgi:hypothetical protein